MRSLFILFLMSIFTGCGMDVKVEPITGEIKHTFQINFDSILSYCNNKCIQQYSSQTDIDACANQCLANFVDILTHATSGASNVR